MTSSRLIRSDNLTGDPLAWRAPAVTGTPLRGSPEQIVALEDTARQRGFDKGHAAGLLEGRREIAQRSKILETVLDALARPVTNLDHRIEEELMALVKAIAQQLVRREINLDPTHIVGVIRAGLAALPASAEEVVVRLHPTDANVVRECLQSDDAEQGWRIETDPLIERGSCQINTRNSVIDGRLEIRLGHVIATMFEDERVAND